MITETSFAKAYRNSLTMEELSLLQSIHHESLEAAIRDLKEQLPYIDEELKEICRALYDNLQKMDAASFARLDLSGEEENNE